MRRDDATLLRDPLVQRLVQPLHLDIQDSRPAIVFINGEYWGLHNIRQRLDNHYLSIRHGVDPEHLDMLDHNGTVAQGSNRDFLDLVSYAADQDLSLSTHFDYVAGQVDTVNLADYLLLQIYSGNLDWPPNNMSYWRPTDRPGKWRWLVYDVEWRVFGHLEADGYLRNDISNALSSDSRVSRLARNMLDNTQYRIYFINRAADHLNTIFEPTHVTQVIQQMSSAIRPHIPDHIRRWGRPSTHQQWERNLGTLRTFAERRPAYMRSHFVEHFGLDGEYLLRVTSSNPKGGDIRLNTITLPQEEGVWSGFYFLNVPIELAATPKPGFRFVGWTGDIESMEEVIEVSAASDTRIIASFEIDPAYPWEEEQGREPHRLREGPYHFAEWPRDAGPGTYPPAMVFKQTSESDPDIGTPMEEPWTLPYDRDSRSRVTGLDDFGFAFINTSNPQEDGGGYLGSARLALDTVDVASATLEFTAGTLIPNDRKYALRLQYRVSPDEDFVDFLDGEGEPVEYVRHETPAHDESFGPIELPEEMLDRPFAELKWRYHHIETGQSGRRAKLFVSEIVVDGAGQEDPSWLFY